MAVPKHKNSKTRKRKRRSHLALKVTSPPKCPNCGATKLPHRVCGTCGYYKGAPLVEVEDEG